MKTRWIVLLLGALGVLGIPTSVALGQVRALPNDDLTGFPFAYNDDGNGFSVGLCMDGPAGHCLGAPVPHPADPYSVPDNFTPDAEAFYWRADAAFPPPFDNTIKVLFAQEAAFANAAGDIVDGDQVTFSRIRFTSVPGSLEPDTWYRISHPYGEDDVQTSVQGQLKFSDDNGCLAPPCNFATAPQGRLTSLLLWDPSAPLPPAGFVGDPLIEHTVVGGPIRDTVTISKLTGKGGSTVGPPIVQTDTFFVTGKLSGPAPTPTAFVSVVTQALTFDAREVGDVAPAQTVTVKNRGSAPLVIAGATIGPTTTADFSVDTSGCTAAVPTGGTCDLAVRFKPTASGPRTGVLTITHNARNSANTVALSGTGTPQHALQILSARLAKGYGRNGKGGLSLSKFKAKGVDLVLGLEPATQLLRIRVIRILPPRAPGGKPRLRLVTTEFVAPSPGANGEFRVRFNPPAVLKAARRGDFRVQIIPLRKLPDMGIPTRLDFTIDHA